MKKIFSFCIVSLSVFLFTSCGSSSIDSDIDNFTSLACEVFEMSSHTKSNIIPEIAPILEKQAEAEKILEKIREKHKDKNEEEIRKMLEDNFNKRCSEAFKKFNKESSFGDS